MRKINNRVGEKHINNQGLEFEIIDYKGSLNATIKYSNGFIAYNVQYVHIKNKTVSNPYHRSMYGVGYLGEGAYKSKINGKNTRVYSAWRNMFIRCYDRNIQEKYTTYKGCSVDESWHNFQVFAKWYEDNFKESWALDKDILIKGNKVYSPKTCCFVPQEINNLFTKTDSKRGEYPIGVSYNKAGKFYLISIPKEDKEKRWFSTIEEAFKNYKNRKEKHIKNIADKWKELISDKVYQAMYNYQVEITD